MCNCTVNWCDKLCFFAFIFAVLLPIFGHRTRWGSKQEHSHRAYIVIFSFLFMWPHWYQSWPLGSHNVTILTIQGHVTSSFMWPFESQWVFSYWWSLSPSIFEIFGPKYIEATTLTFQGHVTSSVTWPFDSQVVISYRCSIGTKSVSSTIIEIMGPKYIGVMTLTFLGHVTSSVTWPFESQ